MPLFRPESLWTYTLLFFSSTDQTKQDKAGKTKENIVSCHDSRRIDSCQFWPLFFIFVTSCLSLPLYIIHFCVFVLGLPAKKKWGKTRGLNTLMAVSFLPALINLVLQV
ncbi:hypothetical protein F5Y17DRAFT_377640 [Xylariaceae sp. FL0594]|nr:hypothetical protein F5Y17DRAFT_377640 [Xylariaceae sp. FL0594]